MSAYFELHSVALAYTDVNATTNPAKKHFDWRTECKGLPVSRPSARQFSIPPGETVQLFNGIRSLALDNTTELELTRNKSKEGVYRLTWVDGTSPEFRQERFDPAILEGKTLQITINGETALFEFNEPLSDIQVGDCMFIPSIKTGDPDTQISPLNSGYWQILRVNGDVVTCRRPGGQPFQAVDQAVTLKANHLFVFGTAGVQVGDKIEIQGGFASVSYGTYKVTEVTSRWVEFEAEQVLPEETAKVGPDDLIVYTAAKRFVRVEVDQPASLFVNGVSTECLRVEPIEAGDVQSVGWHESFGSMWALSIKNRSVLNPMQVNLLTVE